MPRRRYRRSRKPWIEVKLNSRYFPPVIIEFLEYLVFLRQYSHRRLARLFSRFEKQKDRLVDMLYRRRGKYARPFVHSGLMSLLVFMVTLGPLFLSQSAFTSDLNQGDLPSAVVLGATTIDQNYAVGTLQSDQVAQYRGGEVVEYTVQAGDTISSIAEKFNVTQETIKWANDLEEKDTLKIGQTVEILPVSGVLHTVRKGETIYSIAKKYGLEDEAEAQKIVNYPFNEFVNDEKFTLAIGQELVVPDGIIPEQKNTPAAQARYAAALTPDRGTVSATGNFVWPASGRITQGFTFYHKAIDIANRSGGAILAADSGEVIVAGWPDNYGYGNRVVVDHKNGYVTLYAHMSVINVRVGQSVNRGDVLGQMGSTGRSTGTHLHFEVRHGGGLDNPMNHLR